MFGSTYFGQVPFGGRNVPTAAPVGSSTYNFPSNKPLTPTGSFDDGGAGYNMGLKFTVGAAGLTATGLRWWAPVAMTVTPFLNETTGTNRAAGPSFLCAVGWNNVPFTTAYALTNGASYIVGITQTTQKYSFLSGALTNAFTVGPLSTVASAGRLRTGSTFADLNDSASLGTAWYGIDIVATTGGGGGSSPVANAGPDQTVESLSVVTLAGSGTNTPTSYAWTQTSGTAVTLSSTSSAAPSFTAPADYAGQVLVFSLTVTNATGTSSADTVIINVNPHIEWIAYGTSLAWVATQGTFL